MIAATARTDGGYALATLAGLVASMIVMFPTAFCAGMTLPLATHALTSRGHGEASIGARLRRQHRGLHRRARPSRPTSAWSCSGVKGLTGLGAFLDVARGARWCSPSAGAARAHARARRVARRWSLAAARGLRHRRSSTCCA